MKKWFSRCVAPLALALFATGCWLAKPRPNVLIITIDTCRADHIGCYGFTLARTPNIDKLAAEGVRCEDATCTAPITMPSHTAIMTGLYPPSHGVRDNGTYALSDRAHTLAEILEEQGYNTYAIVSGIVLSRRYNLNQGFETYDDDLWAEDKPQLFMIRDRPGAKTADRFLKWLGARSATGTKKPFFAWIHFFDPHQPYDPPPIYRVMSPSLYDGEIASVDHSVGMVLEGLKSAGLADNTIIVLTADHGESLGEHGEKTHAIFVYRATARVPLIFHYPKMLPHGTILSAPVQNVDIAPTVLAMLGIRGGEQMEGVNLVAALQGKDPKPRDFQYTESRVCELGFGMAPLYSITMDGLKYIRAPKPELYDLRTDPHELTNIYAQATEKASALDLALQKKMDEWTKRALDTKATPLAKESMESLHALGYLAGPGEKSAMGGMDPKDGLPLYNKLEDARHLAQKGKWEESGKLLKEIIDVTPKNLSAINILALTYLRMHKFKEARDWYMKSLDVDPTQWRVYGLLGALSMQHGKLDEAKQSFEKALQLSPIFVEAMNNLGFIEAIRDNPQGAKAWYDKATATDPMFPLANRRMGDLYYEAGDYTNALAYYQKSLHSLSNDFQCVIQAASSARHLGDTKKAEDYLNYATGLRDDSWIPLYNLACLKAITGRTNDVMPLLQKSLDAGFRFPGQLQRDEDLTAFRSLPAFTNLEQAALKNYNDFHAKLDSEDTNEETQTTNEHE